LGNSLKKCLIALTALSVIISVPAHASNASGVYVLSVLPARDGRVYFTHTGTRQVPGCASQFSNRFLFNVTEPGGQAILSTLLTAYAAHKPLTIIGTGACDAGAPDTEGLSYFVSE
jgi:hypothetical protein